MEKTLCFLGLTAGLLCSPALAAPDVSWYGGGGYDGYDHDYSQAAIDYPQVNNAGGATNVTASSAWLNGMLLSTGIAAAVVHVYWGTTDGVTNRGNWGAWTNFGACVEGQALSARVSVNAGTTYYYRFYATNTAGDEGWARPAATFSTPSPPVLDSGAGAAPVSYATATLHGNLTAGVSADVSIYWGQDTNAWANTNSLGSRSQGAFGTAISGLSPGTLYYYRCYGTNAYGVGWSDTVAFTTRVASVFFAGGIYDGYDEFCAQALMMVGAGWKGTVFIIR